MPTTKYSSHRIRTYIAQAFIYSSVYGIPLSYGTYLQFHYNTNTYGKLSLKQVALPLTLQLCAMLLAPLPISWAYQQGLWRGSIYIPIAIVLASQAFPVFTQSWMGEVILRGAAQGFALGTLVTVSTLCTASHYKNNIALASTISSSAAFLGAVVYTGIAYGFLPKSQPDMAYLASFGITAGTLGISGWLIKQNRFYSRLRMSPQAQRQPTYGFKTTSSLLFPLGFCLTFSGIFIWPAYMILLIVSPPAQAPVSIAYQQALLMHAFGFLSAAFSCSPWLRSRLGPVNTFISASGIAGACYLTPGWMPWSIITLPLSLVYGACLGAILSLYIKVLYTAAWFGHPEPRTRGAPHLGVGIVLAVSGTLAACGVLGAAAMVDAGLGFRWGMSGSGGVVVLGAVVMGVGRVVGVGRGVIRVV